MAEISERFALASSQRHDALKAQWDARRQQGEQRESSSEFWVTFRREKESILAEISSGEDLEALEARARRLSASITPATAWLSPFDVKRATREAKDIFEAVADAKKKVQGPRKKFGFQKKKATTKKDVIKKEEKKKIVLERPPGFFGDRGQVLTWESTGEIHLDDLEDCVVFINLPVAALRIRHIHRCTVFANAVHGPVHVREATESSLRLTARQLRIHDSLHTDFYVHLASGPIIEDSSSLRFAKFACAWSPPHDHPVSSPGRDDMALRKDAWRDVQDFKWLRPEPSPNYSLLPDADYALAVPPAATAEADRLGLTLLPADEDTLL